MSHSFLHGRQKHISKHQELLCEYVTINQQYFNGVTSQNLKCHTAFHYSWMLCSLMPTSPTNNLQWYSLLFLCPPENSFRPGKALVSLCLLRNTFCTASSVSSCRLSPGGAGAWVPGKRSWTAKPLHNKGPGDLSLGQGNGQWEKRQEPTTRRLPCV